jgi:hypothetical protein
MNSVEFLVKLRDAAQLIADAANEQLAKNAPTQVKYDPEDFDKLFWETKTGTKGEYEQTSKRATNNHEIFQTLQRILKEKKGFCILGGYKYWTHQGDVNVIDRRKR